MIYSLLSALIGCVVGNFVYQAFTKKDWLLALERSWFQVWALLIFGFIHWMRQGGL